MQTSFLHFLTEPHIVDVDVAKSSLQLQDVLDQQTKSLLIITINHGLVPGIKGDHLEELYPAVQFLCGICESQELCLCA